MTWNNKIGALLVGLLLAPGILGAQAANPQAAQERMLKRGATVFAASCTGYCHGANGAAGSSAPVLAARGLDGDYIAKTVMYGIPGTAMTAWGQRIPKDDSAAVIAYVKSLNGIIAAGAAVPHAALAGAAARGRNLFFDSAGELTACSNCHQINGAGIAVTPSIATVPASASDLRNLTTAGVVTATVGAETFPALVATKIQGEIRLYDLTVIPPVLRTFPASEVKISDAASWRHSSVTTSYSDVDLDAILAFLHAVQASPASQPNGG